MADPDIYAAFTGTGMGCYGRLVPLDPRYHLRPSKAAAQIFCFLLLYEVSSQLLVIATDKRTPPTYSIGRLKDHLMKAMKTFSSEDYIYFFQRKMNFLIFLCQK